MNTINISPFLIKYGFIQIRYYSLAYLLGIYLIFLTLKKNKDKLKLTNDQIEDFILYLFLGIIIGARLFHMLIQDFALFLNNPLELFMIWHGGMSFFGGFVGAILAGYIFSKKHTINFFKTADLLVIPSIFALAIGRLANFINQELVGTITNVPWCFKFNNYLGCRHPYQLYASVSHILLFLVLVFLTKYKQKNKLKDGFIFLSFALLYSLIRFVIDFFREGIRYYGLTNWQYVSLIAFVISLFIFIKNRKIFYRLI